MYAFEKITDKGLKALAKHCKNLTSLYLIGYEKITDEGLNIIVSGCSKLKRLKSKDPTNEELAEAYHISSFPQRNKSTCDRLRGCVLQ